MVVVAEVASLEEGQRLHPSTWLWLTPGKVKVCLSLVSLAHHPSGLLLQI